ncbi:hypothetical protein [Massilia yuzhufengensis]|uniref:hypothetical protein n=1 Tax=Massilia yuzhufengensis TaxID=1164594 RepID=UPI0011603874|nr:hypothetical protein [Massilia yuzhufengensis]
MVEKYDPDAHRSEIEARARLISVDAGWLTIHGPSDYEISLDRINSAEKILQWVMHLTEKSWFTNDMLRAFIVAARREIGLDQDTLPA